MSTPAPAFRRPWHDRPRRPTLHKRSQGWPDGEDRPHGPVRTLAWMVALALVTGGCGRKDTTPPSALPTALPAPTLIDPRAALAPVPEQEPSEEVLRRLTFKAYDDIERAGGLQLTVSATGRTLNLRPKLYEVRKASCTPSPQSPPGWYACSLTVRLSLQPDGRDPSEQGERIHVKWDPRGMWVTQ